jgi:CRP-like cAMP-binding protein
MFTLRGPSESCGELSVFDPGPRTSTAVARNDVRAAPLDGVLLRAWIADHPGSPSGYCACSPVGCVAPTTVCAT